MYICQHPGMNFQQVDFFVLEAIFISSNVLGSIFQIASLPVVILAPLGAVSLLWNALFARMILGDLFSKYMAGGTLFIVLGAILIGVYGIVPEPTHSLNDLLRLFRRSTFVAYFSLLGVTVLAILVIVCPRYRRCDDGKDSRFPTDSLYGMAI